MSPELSFMTDLLLPMVPLLVMSRGVRAFLGTPEKRLRAAAGWGIYYACQTAAAFLGPFPPQYMLMGSIALVFLAGTMSGCGSVKKRCLFSVLICTVWMLMEIITALVLVAFGMDGTGLRIAGSVLSGMCMLAIAAIAGQYMLKKRVSMDIQFRYFIILLLIPAGSAYLVHHIFLIASEHREHGGFAFSASAILLLLSYVVFEVYEGLSREAESRERNHLYEQQLELCSRQAEERESLYLEVRRTRHDLKMHLSALAGMVEAGDREGAADYIRKLTDGRGAGQPEEVSRSGNIVVDSLVNHKCSVARQEGIRFEAEIFVPAALPFCGGHLAVILGNLLENALEACRDSGGERWIRLEAAYRKGVLFLTVTNPYQGEVARDGSGKLLTKKKDRERHGIGLSSVEQAVGDYGGALEIRDGDGIFQATVVMYGEK